MFCLYVLLNTKGYSSSYPSPLLVHRFSKTGDKMPNMSVLTTVVKSPIEKSLPTFEILIGADQADIWYG